LKTARQAKYFLARALGPVNYLGAQELVCRAYDQPKVGDFLVKPAYAWKYFAPLGCNVARRSSLSCRFADASQP
jgi:hypothetical protein